MSMNPATSLSSFVTKTNMNAISAKLLPSRDITRKGAARVIEIARAGTEIVLEEGFASLTKRRVAKRLGIAHGNVGYYFPTRESLWRVVVDYELSEIHDRYPSGLKMDTDDPQSSFDEYLSIYMLSYEDREFGSFFAHLEAYADINPAVAKLRDEMYEGFLQRMIERVRPLCIGVDDEQIELRAITVMALFEGLGSVSTFRPELVIHDSKFRQRMIDRANAIVRGD
jgi:AcrR family transcriptional regulator